MPAYRFVTFDVFTERRFGGNPLAVFPDARGLSDADMQALATEFNLSETTFVLPPDDPAHTARVRIFNRTAEMPFAGHPNVGTGFALAQLGRDHDGVMLFEEIAGLVRVEVERDGAGAVVRATIAAPQPLSLGISLEADAIAACAGLQPDDIVTTAHQPVRASVGTGFVLAEVSPTALGRAIPNRARFRQVLLETPALAGRFALYLYSHEGATIQARMFSPLTGTIEDAATGSAAAPLAALRLSMTQDDDAAYLVHQGVDMGRPSLLHVRAWREPGGIMASVGGACVPVLSGEAQV
ncbi:PhzF family phenazine biosynthesis protein [Lichenihabitans sp. PAMC28606]|uniref:PhzF family phenazine biosynthesis protein n=1 Tax=Lichenihabitans sp. PAMC28606 TaxID=2880932 RepID=UPI001D0A094B|nr:PhzF family phenazine biosynthesis protein [Lichenihabitans sp. PAMC28606]UDL96177.1 PhzF family phenazine biosynthesis protein [Lichenihabitans sp. PAMC28606]